jgi:hypothetical protein
MDIKILEKAVQDYKRAYKEEWDINKLYMYDMDDGLCHYFFKKNYDFKNIIWRGILRKGRFAYLCLSPNDIKVKAEEVTRKSIYPRYIFLKTFLEELKKEGYVTI